MYDPYYLLDPSKHLPLATQGRSYGGQFTIKSILSGATEDNFPLEAKYWTMYAVSCRKLLDEKYGEAFRRKIIKDETKFSWRMICEMYEVARDAMKSNPSKRAAVQAAHKHLMDTQYEVQKKLLRITLDNLQTQNPYLCSEIIGQWLGRNWELIPEVPY